jgi:hypothetical protein
MGPTIDQLIANQIGQETVLPSLELASETTIQAAAGGSFYSSTLSFRDAATPLPMEFNPRKVFTQMFGAGDTPEERALLANRKQSLLDQVNQRARELSATLGAEDRVVLDNYLESVRETERRVERASARDYSDLGLPAAPIGVLKDFDAQVRLMFDLIALAYQADVTRVASYFMAGEATTRTYNHVGVSDAFHPLSHHANKRDSLEKLVVIQRYHVERFAEFVAKLAATPDGDGSLLDHSMLLYGSNMGNSDRHNNYPLPNILVGGGAGALKGGQHIDLPERTTLANLHLTILNKAGLELNSFADSTGEIAGV